MLNRRILLLRVTIFLGLAASLVKAAFTHSADWKLDAINPTYAGTWCFHPGPNPTFASGCANATLSTLLTTHMHNELGSGLSIAYYDLGDGRVLGGATWSDWRSVGLPIGLCMSGVINGLDNHFRTICRFAIADNDHDSPNAHMQECMMPHAQRRVTDGCYSPPMRHGPFRLDDTASAVISILGLLITIPGMIFGAYRWYAIRMQVAHDVKDDDVPLFPTGATNFVAHQNGAHVIG